MNGEAPLQRLQRWRAFGGRLRALDVAFAALIVELDPQAPPSLVLAAALLAQLEGRGHGCLPVAELANDAGAVLDWAKADMPPDAAAAFAAWPRDAAAAARAWGGRPVVDVADVDPAAATAGTAPLVLDGGSLYLRRYWRAETVVAAELRSRVRTVDADTEAGAQADAQPHIVTQAPPPDTAALLERLFGTAPQPAGGPDWQQVACAVALRAPLTLVTGGPGTGKTHTAARLLVLLHALHAGPQPLRVALAAPTGKAAARLRQAIDAALQTLRADAATAPLVGAWTAGLGAARTLHALLGTHRGSRLPVHDAARPIEADVVVVDEASMIHLEMMAALLVALPPGARLVLLGDPDQLASVEAGAVLGDICRAGDGQRWRPATARWLALAGQTLPPGEIGAGFDLAQQTVRLRRSRRYEAPIGRLAQAVNRGDAVEALALLRAGGDDAAPALLHAGGDDAAAPALLRAGGDGAATATLRRAGGEDAPKPAMLRAGHDSATASAPLRARDNGAAPSAPPAAGHDGAAAPAMPPASRALARVDAVAADAVIDLALAGYAGYLGALARRPSGAVGFAAWVRDVLARFDAFRVLCAVRAGPWGVEGVNAALDSALAGRLGSAPGAWYAGRPVLVTRNDPDLGVFNGDVGVVLAAPHGDGLRAWFQDGGGLRSVAVGRLADVETAWALTVHKSQGSEFGHVVLVLPPDDAPVATRELVYTGVTRAARAFTLVARGTAPLHAALARMTQRWSGLRARLQAPDGAAQSAGSFTPQPPP